MAALAALRESKLHENRPLRVYGLVYARLARTYAAQRHSGAWTQNVIIRGRCSQNPSPQPPLLPPLREPKTALNPLYVVLGKGVLNLARESCLLSSPMTSDSRFDAKRQDTLPFMPLPKRAPSGRSYAIGHIYRCVNAFPRSPVLTAPLTNGYCTLSFPPRCARSSRVIVSGTIG